jgi:hypothetical protein
MDVAILDMPKHMCAPSFDVGTLGAFFEQPSAVQAKLVDSDEKLIRDLASVLDNQLLAVLEARSVPEFAEVRAKIWPKYVRALRALSDTMSNLAPENEIEIISEGCIAVLSADLQKQRGVRFGDSLTDQAVFTLWTLGKIRSLGQRIHDAGEPSDRAADLKLCSEYHMYSLWAQFHLDCTVGAMKFRKTIPEDVQAAICSGLRASVNAYAIMKEALSLRNPQVEAPLVPALPWDDEDERLLASSMRDINALSDSDDC